MVVMAIAQVGPMTTVTEALATAAGAGALLCSVAVGMWGLAPGLPRDKLERNALLVGHVGGCAGVLCVVVVDVALRYLLK